MLLFLLHEFWTNDYFVGSAAYLASFSLPRGMSPVKANGRFFLEFRETCVWPCSVIMWPDLHCTVGCFQVKMNWIVQTSGFEILRILHTWSIFIEKFLWKSAKLCIIMAIENLQIYGDFEYFLVFTKPEWTGPVLVLKFRCTI